MIIRKLHGARYYSFPLLSAWRLVFYGCGPPPPVPETLPARLTDQEFWNMITDFSEPGGYFRSDNFVSNESGYQNVIPELLKTLKPGGVYLMTESDGLSWNRSFLATEDESGQSNACRKAI